METKQFVNFGRSKVAARMAFRLRLFGCIVFTAILHGALLVGSAQAQVCLSSESCSSDSSAGRALELLSVVYESGRPKNLHLNQDTLNKVSALPAPLYVLSALGPARVGKSTILNAQLARFCGKGCARQYFDMGGTQDAVTRGLWLFPISLGPVFRNGTLIVVDVEGAEKGDSAFVQAMYSIPLVITSLQIQYVTMHTLKNPDFKLLAQLADSHKMLQQKPAAAHLLPSQVAPLQVLIRGAYKPPDMYANLSEYIRAQLLGKKPMGGDEVQVLESVEGVSVENVELMKVVWPRLRNLFSREGSIQAQPIREICWSDQRGSGGELIHAGIDKIIEALDSDVVDLVASFGMDDALVMGDDVADLEVSVENLQRFYKETVPGKKFTNITKKVKEMNLDLAATLRIFETKYGRRPVVCRRGKQCGSAWPPLPLLAHHKSAGSTSDEPLTGTELAVLISNIIVTHPHGVFTGDKKSFLLTVCHGAKTQHISPLMKSLDHHELPTTEALNGVENDFRQTCSDDDLAGETLAPLFRKVCEKAREVFIAPLKAIALSQFKHRQQAALQNVTLYCRNKQLAKAQGDMDMWQKFKEHKYANCAYGYYYIIAALAGAVGVLAFVLLLLCLMSSPLYLAFLILSLVLICVIQSFVPGFMGAVGECLGKFWGLYSWLLVWGKFTTDLFCDKYTQRL